MMVTAVPAVPAGAGIPTPNASDRALLGVEAGEEPHQGGRRITSCWWR